MTPWQSHVARWKDCRRCCLCDGRKTVVLARGKIPCDVLFIGEAPGDSENVLGQPFIGPAGKLLDEIIREAGPDCRCQRDDSIDQRRIGSILGSASAMCLSCGKEQLKDPLRLCFTNLVACFPREEKRAGTNEPPDEAIKACAPRLRELVEITQPRLIVTVGKLSDKWAPQATSREVQWASILHPAAILRAPIAQRSLMIRRTVLQLTKALGDL